MAIGDSFAVLLGTAETDRQPSAGVEEQLTSYVKSGATDKVGHYNGSLFIAISGTAHTGDGYGTVGLLGLTTNDTRIVSTNSVYLRKEGTSDRGFFGGIQTGA